MSVDPEFEQNTATEEDEDAFSDAIAAVNDIDQETKGLEEEIRAVANVASQVQAIARQTNLLALNAKIEAARAGDAGRGFAVVASEVKELSTETTKATEEISKTLESLTKKIKILNDRGNTARDAIGAARLESEYLTEEASRATQAAEQLTEQARADADAGANEHRVEEPEYRVEEPELLEVAAPPDVSPSAEEFQSAGVAASNSGAGDKGPLSRRDIDLVRMSFAKVAPIAEAAAEMFYNRLFEIDPSVRGLFKGNMKQQGQKLMGMIEAAVAGLDDLDGLVPAVRILGLRHGGYGVEASHYDTVADALLWTFAQGLGDEFTPQIEAAWTNVYSVLAQTMIAAAEEITADAV